MPNEARVREICADIARSVNAGSDAAYRNNQRFVVDADKLYISFASAIAALPPHIPDGWRPCDERKEAIRQALETIQGLRHEIACTFDPNKPECRGQRGQDRCDVLYDAYSRVQALLAAPQVKP